MYIVEIWPIGMAGGTYYLRDLGGLGFRASDFRLESDLIRGTV